MSTDKFDTDALATEEMLKMFENMESDDLETATAETESLAADSISSAIMEHDEIDGIDLIPIEMDPTYPAEVELGSNELPEVTQGLSMDAEIVEMPELHIAPSVQEAGDAAAHPLTEEIEVISHDDEENVSLNNDIVLPTLEDVMPEEVISEEEPQIEAPALTIAPATAVATTTPPITSSQNPIANHLNTVVENAVQALQDWLILRQQSEENGPQQGLAQLDVLLDTVTHQQQYLAEQLTQTPKLDFSGIANELGVTLSTPQALGWTHDQWRVKAQEVAHKTDDIAAMNAKLRKQLEQL
jgi:hypothetical protein